jgi:hypothetical protein
MSDIDDPRRMKLRRESDDPNFAHSRTDSVVPKRTLPTSDICDPRRKNDRRDIDEPR